VVHELQDFFHEDAEVAEVDLVLSTTELWRLLEDSFRDQQEQKLPLDTQNNQDKERNDSIEPKLMVGFINSFSLDRPCGQDSIESLFRVFSQNGQQLVNAVDANASSGGFAEYLFKYAAERLYGRDMWSTPLQYKQGRNSDTAEVTLTHPESGKALLTFSRMYGFRNIQSLVLKMKRKRLPMMDYVELMACPSGCANGGGQIKTQVTEHPTEIAERVKKTQSYFHSSLVVGRVEDSPLVKYLYGVLDSQSDLVSRENMFVPNNLFRTTYHAIPKLEVVAPLAAKW
jgi:iron only hydrogenase large subunit-like protein